MAYIRGSMEIDMREVGIMTLLMEMEYIISQMGLLILEGGKIRKDMDRVLLKN